MSLQNLTPEEINELFPIEAIKVSRGGLVLSRYSNLSIGEIKRQHLRGLVKKLSRRSLSNFAWMVGNSSVRFKSLLTLTYGQNFPITGKRLKADLKAFLMLLRRAFGDFSYAWFLEFQERGAPHFHILLTLDNPRDADRAIIASGWSRIAESENLPYSMLELWEGGLVRRGQAYTRDAVRKFHNRPVVWGNLRSVDGAIRYVIQYATKPHQKKVPEWYWDVGRFWGNSREVKNDSAIWLSASDDEVRELVSILGRNMDKWKVLPKIILINNQQFDKFRTMVDNDTLSSIDLILDNSFIIRLRGGGFTQ